MDQFANKPNVFEYGSWLDIIGFYAGVIVFCLVTLLVLRPEIDMGTQIKFIVITMCGGACGRLGSLVTRGITFLTKPTLFKSSNRDQKEDL